MFPQVTSFLEYKVFCHLVSHRVFVFVKVLIVHEHADSPIVGASDVSQVSTCPFM